MSAAIAEFVLGGWLVCFGVAALWNATRRTRCPR